MLLIIVVLVLVFGFGGGYWGYNRYQGNWAYGGGFGLGSILLVILVLWLLSQYGGFHLR
jgi:uncharacterized spore protein YtfJ